MSETTGRSRGNPAPRRALARFSPRAADEGEAAAPGQAAAADELAEESPAAAPGGTAGRDLLIPGRRGSRSDAGSTGQAPAANGKNGRGVPSLADLMPPAAPSGRRPAHGHGRGHGEHRAKKAADTPVAPPSKGEEKAAKGKTVELTVRVPKSVRKQLKARSHELGLTPEEAVARLLEVWLET